MAKPKAMYVKIVAFLPHARPNWRSTRILNTKKRKLEKMVFQTQVFQVLIKNQASAVQQKITERLLNNQTKAPWENPVIKWHYDEYSNPLGINLPLAMVVQSSICCIFWRGNILFSAPFA